MASTPEPLFIEVTPRSFALPHQALSVIEVLDAPPHALMAGVAYESDENLGFNTEVTFTAEGCFTSEAKEFESGFDGITSITFAAYRGVNCNAVGRGVDPIEEYGDVARRRFEMGESHAIEKKLIETLGLTATPADVSTVGMTVDEATAEAVASFTADYYGIPTVVTSVAPGLLLLKDDMLGTAEIPHVIAYGGEQSQRDKVFVAGRIILWRGPINVHRVIDPETNDVWALAERQYVLSIEGTPRVASLASTTPPIE